MALDGRRLSVFPTLDLVVAMNCGNYRKSGSEQSRINGVVLTEVVLPRFVQIAGAGPTMFTSIVRGLFTRAPGSRDLKTTLRLRCSLGDW